MIKSVSSDSAARSTHTAQTTTEGSASAHGLKFVGFDPTSKLVERAMAKINRVFGESPSDSSTTGEVQKTATGFKGHLKIRSAVGTFFAEVISEDPFKVVDSLSLKVRSQLRLWKRVRALEAPRS